MSTFWLILLLTFINRLGMFLRVPFFLNDRINTEIHHQGGKINHKQKSYTYLRKKGVGGIGKQEKDLELKISVLDQLQANECPLKTSLAFLYTKCFLAISLVSLLFGHRASLINQT